jgi:hypothetical protein
MDATAIYEATPSFISTWASASAHSERLWRASEQQGKGTSIPIPPLADPDECAHSFRMGAISPQREVL